MADRTVSVRLRAEIGDFVAEMRIAGDAVDGFDRKVDGAGKRTSDSFTKAGEATEKSATLMRSELVTLIAAAVALSPPVIAAAAAFGAFGAVAAPSIVKVVKAQEDLAGSWSTLDGRQKSTSENLNTVIGQYKDLAAAYEPQALAVFNSLLGDTSVLMSRAGPLLDAGAAGVANFTGRIDSFVTGGTMTRFLDFAAQNAGPAFDELGQTFTETGTLALNLVQDLAPMGLQLLNVANGGLRLLNALEQVDPRLVEIGATMLAVRGPANALANLWTSGAGKLSKFGKAATTANTAVKSSPNLYIAAALAVGLLSWHWATANDAVDNHITAIRAEANATKNSVASHQVAIAALGRESVGWTTYSKAVAAGDEGLRKHASAFDQSASVRIRKAIDAEAKAVTNITKGQSLLASQYGITADQASQLATAAGVDLSKGITGSGQAATAARQKIKQYQEAVAAAQDPTRVIARSLEEAGNKTLALKDRMTALTNAFSALVGPELAAFDGATQTARAFAALDQALRASHGSLSLNTAKGQEARAAFASLMSTVEQTTQAQYQYDSATRGAAVAAANMTARARAILPVLLAEAGNSRQARAAVLNWANAHGVGKTRADALTSAMGRTRSQFLAAAHDAGVSKAAADRLWNAYHRLPGSKNTTLHNNAPTASKAVQDYQNKLDSLHGKTVYVHTVYTSSGSRTFGPGNKKLGDKEGGLYKKGFAKAGEVSGLVTGPGTGTSDSIPFPWLSNGEYIINALSTAKYRPWVDAINQDRLGDFIRRMRPGGVPTNSQVRTAAPAGGGPTITQTFYTQQMNAAELARNVARETAWVLN